MYKVSIDRIGLVMPVANKEMHGHFCGLFSGMKGESGYKYWKAKYQTNASVPLSKEAKLGLQVGISHHKPYVRFDFKPGDLGPTEWEQMHMHLGYMLEYGYASVLAESHVTYLEIAVDCTGVKWKEHFTFDRQLRNSGWFPDYYHPCPTGYLGRRGSNRVIRGYDRVARLKALGKTVGVEPITRIEASLRKLASKVVDLPTVDNPFTSVGVCRFVDAEAQSSDKGWKQFLQHCRYVGACEAMQLVGGAKKKYLTRLSSVACDWWSPTGIWTLYPQALKALQG